MKYKKYEVIIVILILVSIIIYLLLNQNNTSTLQPLPKPEKTTGLRGDFNIDKNINESNIDNYLNREDTVYRDVRMLKDPANYEKIGGDSYLSGFIKGFEVVSLPYLVNVTNLPDTIGKTYQGKTLFTLKDNKYTPNYKESLEILEYLFPKDKNIFLMCGAGGYAGQMKEMLISLGWDENKIYNIGGYWYYDGNNNIDVKNEKYGKTTYDFWKVNYHEIDFTTLHKI